MSVNSSTVLTCFGIFNIAYKDMNIEFGNNFMSPIKETVYKIIL